MLRSADMLTVLMVFVVTMLTAAAQSCHYLDRNPYRNFGILTDYQAAKLSLATYAIDTSYQATTLDCVVLSYWQFSREGTSLPEYGLVDPSTTDALLFLKTKIIESHQLGRGSLCAEDLSALVSWTGPPVGVLEGVGELTSVGAHDLYATARRYSSAFFGPVYDFSPASFRVVHSSSSASYSSALAILHGMTPPTSTSPHLGALTPQLYLRGSDDLTQYKCRLSSEVWRGAGGEEQEMVAGVTESVRVRLGLPEHLFGRGHLQWTYDACRAAVAVDPSAYSPWCAIFSKPELELLELVDDSIWYRRLGLHRHNYEEMINYELMPACRSLQHLMEYFRGIVEEGHFHQHRLTSARVIVSDASALLRLLAVLGVNAEATPVTATDPAMLHHRRWRVSELAPFGGHLVLTLTRCHQQEFFVRAYLQETPFPILNCPTDCPWGVFLANVDHLLGYCPDVLHCPSSANAVTAEDLVVLLLGVTIILGVMWGRDGVLLSR
ncbi:multiple inositol polyphosphate phosphatase 1 [Hyalella azteca]|uniref:Multiple inositol polyphosphate phosphatase 1 n=1 Tax=Hyalella azteca TaxID=294128 RepID=A0A8B7NPB1_HYAAZ|nr:multiple inositol polyphosphate phosphatase 1 [Hyalella azteca]